MIPVKAEPRSSPTVSFEQERCCFCRARTSFWTEMPDRKPGDQVACCEGCARQAFPADVPSKRVWCRREDIATPATFGEISQGRGPREPRTDEIATYPPRRT